VLKINSLILFPGIESMPMLHTYVYAGSYRLSRVWSRGLAGKLHHTWETGSSLPAGGDHCTHGGPFVCTTGTVVLYYEIVYGTEWYGTVRNETETKYSHCIRARTHTTTGHSRVRQQCPRFFASYKYVNA